MSRTPSQKPPRTASREGPAKAPRKPSGKSSQPLPLIGWREWLALPELGVDSVKAKIDTGARTSSLHAFDVEPYSEGGVARVRFVLHPFQRDLETTIEASAPLLEERWIRSSNGKRSLRPVISTTVRVGEISWPIEITLVRRDLMGFRMLLGREAVRNRFIVHPGRSYLTRPKPAADAAGRKDRESRQGPKGRKGTNL